MKSIFAILALTLTTSSFAFFSFQKSVLKQTPTITLTDSNSIIFNQQVTGSYVAQKELELIVKSLKYSGPLYLVLDTPGGSVSAGNQFIDFVKGLGRPVHTIVLFAASMGYQITQELDNRYITTSGMLMSHRGAVGGLSGQVPGELNARLKMIGNTLAGMNDRAAKRVGMTTKAYQEAIVNELWIGGEEAVKQGHADLVVQAKCDKSLSGTYTETFNTIFGPVEAEFSKCPLISEPVGFKLGNIRIGTNSIHAGEVRKIMNNKMNIKLEF